MSRVAINTSRPRLEGDGMLLVTMCFVNDIGLKRFFKLLRRGRVLGIFKACGFVGIDGEIDEARCQAATDNVIEFCAANGWVRVE